LTISAFLALINFFSLPRDSTAAQGFEKEIPEHGSCSGPEGSEFGRGVLAKGKRKAAGNRKPSRARGAAVRRSRGKPATEGPKRARSSDPTKNHFPIVGVGASAGGLEAFNQLLSRLPADTGMAFVLIQHLDPKRESMLSEILSRATTMPVREVESGMAVKANNVFVIPANADIGLSDGTFRVVQRQKHARPHKEMPIDYFFASLAEQYKSRAIGIILSGTLSDGALGLRAIKAEGGLTFAQEESSAKFHDMPRAAIAAGSVDFVFPPDQIAAELTRMGKHP